MSEADDMLLDELVKLTQREEKLLTKVKWLEASLLIVSGLLLIATVIDCVLRVKGIK